ncbi:hypothetical protein H4R19_000493 [Coemansia spiralis]|nr:hypothetical protein H4R19_000493 [Coemansia spiralis]
MSAYRACNSESLLNHFAAVVPRGIVFFYDDRGVGGARRSQQLKPMFQTARTNGYQCAIISRARIGDICARHLIDSREGAIIYARGQYVTHFERLDDSIAEAIIRQRLSADRAGPPPRYQLRKPDAAPARYAQKLNRHASKPLPVPATDLSYRLTKKLPALPPGAQC